MKKGKAATLSILLGSLILLILTFSLNTHADTFTDRGTLARKALEYMIQWNNETASTRSSYMGASQCAAFSRYIFYHLYGYTDGIGNSGTGAENNNTVITRTFQTVDQVASFIRTNAAPGDAVRVTGVSTHIVHLLNITSSNKMVICESNIGGISSNRAWYINESVYEFMHYGAGWSSGSVEVKIIHSNNNHLTSSNFDDSLLGSKAAYTDLKAAEWNNTWSSFQIPSEIYSDTYPPEISNARITNLDKNGYTVTCNVSDDTGVTRVTFPTWTDANWQDDIVWQDGAISNGVATFRVNISDHGNQTGDYLTYIYAYDAAGNVSQETNSTRLRVYVDGVAPIVSNVRVVDSSKNGYTVQCDVSDDVGVVRVAFPTWTNADWQDDIIWQDGSVSNGVATFRVNISDHGNQLGEYLTYIYAYDAAGNVSEENDSVRIHVYLEDVAPTISNVRVTDVTEVGYTVSCDVNDNVGVTRVAFPTWTLSDWQDDILWLDGEISDGVATFHVNISDHGNQTGRYCTYIYAYDALGNVSEENDNTRVKVDVGILENPELPDPDFILPINLTSIDEEAFMGIDAEVVLVPESCISIGARAFADCPNLRYVIVPDLDAIDVAADALEGTDAMFVEP